MNIAVQEWCESDGDHTPYVNATVQQFRLGDLSALHSCLIFSERYDVVWDSNAGQLLLAEMLNLVINSLEDGDVEGVRSALQPCPAGLADKALDLLLLALSGDAEPDGLMEVDDAALLCMTFLAGKAGRIEALAPSLQDAWARRPSSDFGVVAVALMMDTVPIASEPFKAKLIIWDLDDTLWRGTLADGDEPCLFAKRADLIRALNRHGIVSAICSKNDFAIARGVLEEMKLWSEFVFPRIAFVPKGDVVRQMISDMQLRPANVLFIDDNVRNLSEVAAAVPGISVVNANSPDCDLLLQSLVDDNVHVQKNRIGEYRILEARLSDRQHAALTDESFLLQSAIQATYTHRMDNLDFADRIEELINRSNQLNYTQSRIAAGTMRDVILNVSDFDVYSAFVWDRYGYYGLVGAAVFDKHRAALVHFAFSCRVMHMGVEDFLLKALADRYPQIDLGELKKPLPSQRSGAITALPFEAPEVRTRVLAAEAPRNWSLIDLRLMCDCQSGAFHHYSRSPDHIDFDNIPRVFTLKMMMTGEYTAQNFPRFLVYTPATDYADWRWDGVVPLIDPDVYAEAAERFVKLLVDGNHRLLLFLPPEQLSDARYDVIPTATVEEMRSRNREFNHLWRRLAVRHTDRIACIDLDEFVSEGDVVGHAYHYVPSILRRMAGMIDDWYDQTLVRL